MSNHAWGLIGFVGVYVVTLALVFGGAWLAGRWGK